MWSGGAQPVAESGGERRTNLQQPMQDSALAACKRGDACSMPVPQERRESAENASARVVHVHHLHVMQVVSHPHLEGDSMYAERPGDKLSHAPTPRLVRFTKAHA